jgi:CRISPR-associated protein Csm4
LDIYVTLDDARFSLAALQSALEDIGRTGYGKDASTGMGVFAVMGEGEAVDLAQKNSTSWLTLASCASQGLGYDAQKSYWQPFTRYGRHGSLAALGHSPYKNPVLMACAGSVFTANPFSDRLFVGQGLGGRGELSSALKETVHQGYAPVLAVNLAAINQRIAAIRMTGESA